MRVLMIDGNPLSAQALQASLTTAGFQVSVCDICQEGVEWAKTFDYDAIVMSREFGDLPPGVSIAQVRAAGVTTPILALLNDGLAASRVEALKHGADDCLSKPFHRSELFARLRAIVRRWHSHPHSMIRIGDLEIDIETREARVAGSAIHLTKSEYRTLELLALRKGKVVSKEALFEALYDGSDDPEDRVINVFVCKIRKKIAAVSRGENYISTSWGGGYRLHEPLTARAAAA